MSTIVSEPQKLGPLSVFVEPEIRERLVKAARANERSVSSEIRVALKRHLGLGEERAEAVSDVAYEHDK